MLPVSAEAFQESDYGKLIHILAPIASKWQFLASQLEFTHHEISNIRSKLALLPEAPLSYLQEVIGLWLQHKPPKHLYPLKSTLFTALKSDAVDEAVLLHK